MHHEVQQSAVWALGPLISLMSHAAQQQVCTLRCFLKPLHCSRTRLSAGLLLRASIMHMPNKYAHPAVCHARTSHVSLMNLQILVGSLYLYFVMLQA